MISPDLIAKVTSVALGIFSGDLKEHPTLVCLVLQNTNYVCESPDNAFFSACKLVFKCVQKGTFDSFQFLQFEKFLNIG